jgi:cytochrome P450
MTQLVTVPLAQADLPFIDLDGEDWLRDPWKVARELRAKDPRGGRLACSRRGLEVLDYELYQRISNDALLDSRHDDSWADQGAGPLLLDFVDKGHLLTVAAERHLKIRRVMVRAFAISKVEQQRDWFTELANSLVDRFVDSGSCDVIQDFSHRYSIEILCHMIGVPSEDIPEFDRVTLEIALMHSYPLAPNVPRLESALQTLWDYVSDIVTRRRAAPEDDFISALIEAQEAEGRLSEPEMMWNIANLLFAGHDTTRYQLAATTMGIVRAGLWEELAQHPELVPAAIEEGIRMFPVVHVTYRVVRQAPYVVDSVEVPRGTILCLNWFAFNRDPRRFENPDTFDVHREGFAHRLPFGGGLHKCIGHVLARADLEAGLEVLTSRLTDVQIADDSPWHPYSGGMGGPTRMPMTFTARAGHHPEG